MYSALFFKKHALWSKEWTGSATIVRWCSGPLHHQQQPELSTQGRMHLCFHAAYGSKKQDSLEEATFSSVPLFNFGLCFPFKVYRCVNRCSSSASRFNMLCIQRCSSASLSCNECFSLVALACMLRSLTIFLQPLVSKRHFCSGNCHSLDIFSFLHHSL